MIIIVKSVNLTPEEGVEERLQELRQKGSDSGLPRPTHRFSILGSYRVLGPKWKILQFTSIM